MGTNKRPEPGVTGVAIRRGAGVDVGDPGTRPTVLPGHIAYTDTANTFTAAQVVTPTTNGVAFRVNAAAGGDVFHVDTGLLTNPGPVASAYNFGNGGVLTTAQFDAGTTGTSVAFTNGGSGTWVFDNEVHATASGFRFPDGSLQTSAVTTYLAPTGDGSGLSGVAKLASANTFAAAQKIGITSVGYYANSGHALQLHDPAAATKHLNGGYDLSTGANGIGYLQAIAEGVTYTPLCLNPLGANVGVNTASPAYPLDVSGTANATAYRVGGTAGVSGSFTTVDGKTVTVTNGIVTGIV